MGGRSRSGVARTWQDHEWTVVDGRLLHAAASGSPGLPTVVLVHGQGMSHRYSRPLAHRLSRHARVVALDLPGFGFSRCEEPALDVRGLSAALVGWLRATRRQGVTVVGHSTGCQVVADAAARCPEAVGRVVLAGATVDVRARSWHRQAARLAADVLLERPDLLPVLARDLRRCGPRRYRRTFDHMLAHRVEDDVARLRGPVLVVRGRWDPVSPRAWNDALAGLLADGLRAEVPGVGHNVVWTRAERFARLLRAEVEAAVADPSPPVRSG